MKSTSDDIMRDLARRLVSPEDVLCLHAICQPCVTEMQNVIRFQRQQLDQCAKAINYFMQRVTDERALQHLMLATEAYRLLTNALAEIEDKDAYSLCEAIMPGSGRGTLGEES